MISEQGLVPKVCVSSLTARSEHLFAENMNYGGKLALLGFQLKDAQIDWNQVIFKGLTLKGIYGREMFETWYKMGSMLQSDLDLSPVITHQFSFSQGIEGFELASNKTAAKVIFGPEK